jgi:hypothetical protein
MLFTKCTPKIPANRLLPGLDEIISPHLFVIATKILSKEFSFDPGCTEIKLTQCLCFGDDLLILFWMDK